MAPVIPVKPIPVKPLPVTDMVPGTNSTIQDCGTLTLEEIDYLHADNAPDQAAKLLR